MQLLLESKEQRTARILAERLKTIRTASASLHRKRKVIGIARQGSSPTQYINMSIWSEQKELEQSLKRWRDTERHCMTGDELDTALNLALEREL